ncbi:PilW family protein [Saccharococcus caldoxylosilyticus]|jgi:prepilin-type N-terminal cleavage/methylation domain-containing protein|uniref:PilW family protein n=1 Tax=Saccharococcus caldoxylosilyticus TaxID=81408 RepID=UPI0002D4FCBC|nr:prepilin-type N-terminal cleavage/methylation domain-containing protein [Parageobacillus caldoxylosilyticus]
MRRYVNNAKGLSLVELLAAMTISSLILASIYGVFLSGLNAYKRINIENQLRSEADYLVAAIMNKLYQFSPDGLDMEETTDQQLQFVTDRQKVINPSVGIVEEQKTNGETLTVSLQQDAVLLNGEQLHSALLKIVSSQSELSYRCAKQEDNICRSGVVTIKLSVQDRDHDDPDGLLYIKPFTLKTEFGF